MIIEEVPVKLFLPPPPAPRGHGIHVSGIIRAIALEMGFLKKEWAEELSLVDVREITDPVAVLRISIGLAWESWYIPQILESRGVIDHPGELNIQGIYATHDGESLDSVMITPERSVLAPVVHEIKATYKSTRTVGDLTGEWMWLAQVKAYCKGLETRFARVHVLFLCGDYSKPIRPLLKEWFIEFEQSEIDSTWETMMEYVKYRMRKERPTDATPPLIP